MMMTNLRDRTYFFFGFGFVVYLTSNVVMSQEPSPEKFKMQGQFVEAGFSLTEKSKSYLATDLDQDTQKRGADGVDVVAVKSQPVMLIRDDAKLPSILKSKDDLSGKVFSKSVGQNESKCSVSTDEIGFNMELLGFSEGVEPQTNASSADLKSELGPSAASQDWASPLKDAELPKGSSGVGLNKMSGASPNKFDVALSKYIDSPRVERQREVEPVGNPSKLSGVIETLGRGGPLDAVTPDLERSRNTRMSLGQARSFVSGSSDLSSFQISALRSEYEDLRVPELKKNLERSLVESVALSQALLNAQGKGDEATLLRARQINQNALDQTRRLLDVVQKLPESIESQKSLKEITTSPTNELEKEVSERVKDVLGGYKNDQTTIAQSDQNARAMALFNGLGKDEKARFLERYNDKIKSLGLSQGAKEGFGNSLASGPSSFRDSKGGSCASFLGKIVSTELRKTDFNSLDLWGVGVVLNTGALPIPPMWKASSAEKIQRLATYFTRVFPQKGEPIVEGDIIVNRVEMFPNGQVFVVEKFEPSDYRARVWRYDVSGDLSKRLSSIELSAKNPNSGERYLRPGVMVLRIKSLKERDCTMSI